MTDVKGKANALKMARYLGCSGAHRYENNWFPCKDRETLLKISNQAEDTSSKLPEEKKADKKRKRRSSNWENMGRSRGVSSIDTLSGGGLVSGAVGAKSFRRIGAGDPDVFATRRGARLRARQLGCIGIRQYSMYGGGSGWMPCTNESDYRRSMGTSEQARRDTARNDIRKMRRIMREIREKKSVQPHARRMRSHPSISLMQSQKLSQESIKTIKAFVEDHNRRVSFMGLDEDFQIDTATATEIWIRGAKSAGTNHSLAKQRGMERLERHLLFLRTNDAKYGLAVIDADLISKTHPWHRTSVKDARQILLSEIDNYGVKGIRKRVRLPRKKFKPSSYDGDGDGFTMNPRTGKDDLPYTPVIRPQTPSQPRPVRRYVLQRKPKRPNATYDKIKANEGSFPKRVDNPAMAGTYIRDIAATQIGDTWIPGIDLQRIETVPTEIGDMPLREWNGLPTSFKEIVSQFQEEAARDFTPDQWREILPTILSGKSKNEQWRLTDDLTDPEIFDDPLKLSPEVMLYVDYIANMRSDLAARQRNNPSTNLISGPRLSDDEFAGLVAIGIEMKDDYIDAALNGRIPGVDPTRSGGLSLDDVDELIYKVVRAELPGIASEDDAVVAQHLISVIHAAGKSGDTGLEDALISHREIHGDEIVDQIRSSIVRGYSASDAQRTDTFGSQWQQYIPGFAEESLGIPDGVDVPHAPDDPDWRPYLFARKGFDDDLDPDFVPPSNEELVEGAKMRVESVLDFMLQSEPEAFKDWDSVEELTQALAPIISQMYDQLASIASDPIEMAAYNGNLNRAIQSILTSLMSDKFESSGFKKYMEDGKWASLLTVSISKLALELSKTGYSRYDHGDIKW